MMWALNWCHGDHVNMAQRDGACSIAIGAGVRFLRKRAEVANGDEPFTYRLAALTALSTE